MKSSDKLKVIIVSGKRKKAIARATISSGNGLVRINDSHLSVYGNEMLRLRVSEPLSLAPELASKVNIRIKVSGGGVNSQSEAARLTIARGLVKYFDDSALKKLYTNYDRNLLVADDRQTEPQKPCRSSARRGKQTSKR